MIVQDWMSRATQAILECIDANGPDSQELGTEIAAIIAQHCPLKPDVAYVEWNDEIQAAQAALGLLMDTRSIRQHEHCDDIWWNQMVRQVLEMAHQSGVRWTIVPASGTGPSTKE
jgi:hypothetical protein